MIKSITPFLWFDKHAEDAARFYVSLFPNSEIESSTEMITTFSLSGQRFMALNGGPVFRFTPAFSMFVSVETQAEVDDLWNKLLAAGGEESRCGWLTDKYGLSWQIIPTVLGELMNDDNEAKVRAVFDEMMQMLKIDIAALQKAYDSA